MSGIRDTDDLEYYSYKQLTKLFGSNQLKDPAVNTSSSSSSSSEHSSDDSDDSSSNNNSKYSSTFDRKNRKDIIIKTSSTEHDYQPAAELKYRMNDQSVVSAAAISYNNVIDDTKNTTNVTINSAVGITTHPHLQLIPKRTADGTYRISYIDYQNITPVVYNDYKMFERIDPDDTYAVNKIKFDRMNPVQPSSLDFETPLASSSSSSSSLSAGCNGPFKTRYGYSSSSSWDIQQVYDPIDEKMVIDKLLGAALKKNTKHHGMVKDKSHCIVNWPLCAPSTSTLKKDVRKCKRK